MASTGSRIQLTVNGLKGIGVLKKQDPNRICELIEKIMTKMPVKSIGEIFSAEDLIKFQAAFEIPSSESSLLLTACLELVQEISFHSLKPAIFEQELRNFGLDEEFVSLLSKIWNENWKNLLERLRFRSNSEGEVKKINFSLNVESSNSNQARLNQPNCNLIFDFSSSKIPLALEFDHAEIFNLFENLEQIQKALDNLR